MEIRKRISTVVLIIILTLAMLASYISVAETAYGEPGDGIITEEPPVEDPTPPVTEEPPVGEPEPPVTPIVPPNTNNQTPSNPETSTPAGSNQTPQSTVDTRLSELNIACGVLVPEFSPDQYEYTVYVSRDQENKNCGTTAVAVDPASTSIRAEGPTEFADQDVQKKVIVEGNDGSSSEYIIDVHVLKSTELYIDGKLYAVSDALDVKTLPGIFKETDTKLGEEKIKAARSQDGNLYMVCFINTSDDADVLWYMLSSDKKNIYPAAIIDRNGEKYISLSSGLLYGTLDGKPGYYLIEPESGELVLAINNSAGEKDAGLSSGNNYLIFALAAVVVICIMLCTWLLFKNKKILKIRRTLISISDLIYI